MHQVQFKRTIQRQVVVPASPARVWEAWATADGIRTFFAPDVRLELAVGGAYEPLFDLDAPPGQRGAEGCRVLSYLPGEMLSFDWNAPPRFPTLRAERTWVVVQLSDSGQGDCRVELTHLGWGQGAEWDRLYAYFERAWELVLNRLVRRFSTGPIDWGAPSP